MCRSRKAACDCLLETKKSTRKCGRAHFLEAPKNTIQNTQCMLFVVKVTGHVYLEAFERFATDVIESVRLSYIRKEKNKSRARDGVQKMKRFEIWLSHKMCEWKAKCSLKWTGIQSSWSKTNKQRNKHCIWIETEADVVWIVLQLKSQNDFKYIESNRRNTARKTEVYECSEISNSSNNSNKNNIYARSCLIANPNLNINTKQMITSTARGQMKPRMSTLHTNYTDYDNIAA